VASWLLVGAGSERQVIAVVFGSGIGNVLIELWFPFVWLDTLCERGVSIWCKSGGPSTIVSRECYVWASSLWDLLLCAVRFLGRAMDFVHWGLISSNNEGVDTLSATLP
jgi:hypothetical protein